MPTPRYDLIAIDLDGTLLCERGRVSSENIEAVRRARAAGVRVAVCTGRGLLESQHINRQIEQTDPVVVAGGAMLACPVRERTLHRFAMDPLVVADLVEAFTGHGHAALLLKDPDATAETPGTRGHDYLVVSPRGEAGIDPTSRWWFDQLRIGYKVVPSIADDPHPEHTVRVGVCGQRPEVSPAAARVETLYGDALTFCRFHADVSGPATGRAEHEVLIFEAFARGVNKWTAIRWLAEREGIEPARIAAIGNDVNDVAMLRGAGLPIAMANAVEACRAVARRHTRCNNTHGVAHAIQQILAGEW